MKGVAMLHRPRLVLQDARLEDAEDAPVPRDMAHNPEPAALPTSMWKMNPLFLL